MWNVIDFITNALYVATIALRVVAYYRVQAEMENQDESTNELQREQWDTWDPMLLSEGLFSAANIFRSLSLSIIGHNSKRISVQIGRVLRFLSILLYLFSSLSSNELQKIISEMINAQTREILFPIINPHTSLKIMISVNGFIELILNKYFLKIYLPPLQEIDLQILFCLSKIVSNTFCSKCAQRCSSGSERKIIYS